MTTPSDPTRTGEPAHAGPARGAAPGTSATRAETPSSREEIEADIAATRARLESTVDALGQKLDVKTRARRRMQQQPAIPIGAAAALVLVVALVIWRKRAH